MPQPRRASDATGAFSFLVAACRWPDDAARHSAIQAAAACITDWEAVLIDATQHRVMPLASGAMRGISAVPEEIVKRGTTIARHDGMLAMVQTAELFRIGAAFTERGIDWITVKGPALALLAYGNVGTKASHDIDLLIDPSARVEAFAALQELGYISLDGQDRAAPGSLDLVLKDSAWRHPGNRVMVELHTRLFANRALVPTLGLQSPREAVAFGAEHRLPSLARPELLVYLAVHGASTNWHRLKWIADFNALSRQSTIQQLEAAQISAAAMGTRDIYDSAVMLSATLFNASPSLPLPAVSRHAKYLLNASLRNLTAPHKSTVRDADWDRSIVVYIDRMRLMQNWTYLGDELRLILGQVSSYAPNVPWWRRWTAIIARVSRFMRRKLTQAVGR